MDQISGTSELPPSIHGKTRVSRGALWRTWTWVAWFLALFIPFHSVFFDAGWESLVLWVFSPILVPGFALLNLLPRFVLRRRGHMNTPLPIATILPVHWALVFTAVLSLGGTTDAGDLPSGLSLLVGQPLWPDVEESITLVCAIGALSMWLAMVILSFILKPSTRWRGRVLAPALAWSTAVSLIVAAPFVAATLTSYVPDGSGIPLRDAKARSALEESELASKRGIDTHQELVRVRQKLAPNESDMDPLYPEGTYGSDSNDSYRISQSFTSPTPLHTDEPGFAAMLHELGYSPEGYYWQNASGQRLRATNADDGRTIIEIMSPWWWGDSEIASDATLALRKSGQVGATAP